METSQSQPRENSNFHTITLGLKKDSPYGEGCRSFSQNSIINGPTSQYPTLGTWRFDVYQGNCRRNFDNQFATDNNKQQGKDLVLAGVAGGAGTLIAWLAKQPQKVKDRTKALVVESVAVDSSFAIHYAEQKCKPITYLPFARLWLPFLALTYYPTYNPFGIQPIESAHRLPKNLPVIIMHGTKDPICPINGARQLYSTLRKDGNNNVFLMENDSSTHVDILEEDPQKEEKIKALQAIYKRCSLPYNQNLDSQKPGTSSAFNFQPSTDEVKKRIQKTRGWSRFARNGIDLATGTLLFTAFVLYNRDALSI